ncbi:MAG: glycoside hydrolase family 15 protein [Myxococcota bacterium]
MRILPKLLVVPLATLAVSLAWPAHAALPPVQAYGLRTTTNGRAAVVVDEATGRVRDFFLHLYRHRSPTETTTDVLYDAYFGLRPSGGQGVWANALPHPVPFAKCLEGNACVADEAAFGYVGTTGIVRDVRVQDGVLLQTHAFAPQTLAGQAMVLVAVVRNTASTQKKIDLGLLLNAHVGPGTPEATEQAEQILQVSPHALYEKSPQSPHALLYRALDGAGNRTPSGPDSPTGLDVWNPWDKFQKNQAFSTDAVSSVGTDRVAGLQWSDLTLAPGAERTLGVLVLYGENATAATLTLQADLWLAGRTALGVLQDELAEWQTWQGKAKLPQTLTPQEEFAARRSLAQLRMGQVREPNTGPPHTNQTPNGQIVASLPPGMWNYTWPRDQAYAAVALTAAGHLDEARAALDFLLAGQTGSYQAEVGAPYLISPTRYFGGGLEESDHNQDGPNIEFDGFGLVLWQAARYVQASNDLTWLQKAWPDLRDGAAELLVQFADGTGLIKPDSSIWEVHWNGKQKHFAYTSLTAVRGLCGAAELATAVGQGDDAAKYRKAAQGIRNAVQTKLVGSNGALLGNLEESQVSAVDAAAVEAFLDGQLGPAGAVANATLSLWQQKLAAGGGPGFFRNDDGGEYDSKEWLFIDLRLLRWMDRRAALGQVHPWAAPLRQRVLDVALAGGGILPELLATQGATAGQFDGAIPMMGFGGGALLLALGGADWDDDLTACLAPQNSDPDPGPDTGDDAEDQPDAPVETVADADAEVMEPPDTTLDTTAETWMDADDVGSADSGGDVSPTAVREETSSGGCTVSQGSRVTESVSPWLLLATGGLLVIRRKFGPHRGLQ